MKNYSKFASFLVVIGIIFNIAISYTYAVQPIEPDECGEEYTYTFSSGGQNNGDDQTKPANINYIDFNVGDAQMIAGNPDSVTVWADAGFEITKVELSVDDDNEPGFYQYASGPVTGANPNPGTTINVAKVTVKKVCQDVCPNIAGDQYTIPEGMILDGGQCVLPPVDVCPNVTDVQTSGSCADQVCTESNGIWNVEGQTCIPDACPLDIGHQADPADCEEEEKICPQGYTGTPPNCIPPPQEPPVNSCFLPESEEGSGLITIGTSPEKSVQQILVDAGYTVNANADQTNHQVWDAGFNQVTLEITKLDALAGNPSVFGYYLNDGGLETFVPIFEHNDHPDFSVPSYIGPITLVIPTASNISFGINTYDGGVAKFYSTDPSDNSHDGNNDHVASYNPLANEYVIAFEDLVIDYSDKDYNDMVVKVKLTACGVLECEIYSDNKVKVTEVKVAENPSTFPNIFANLVSTVPAIQGLYPGAWQANVNNPSAKWIWSEDPVADHEVEKWVTFQRDFIVTSNPTLASLNIAADNSYEVWLNDESPSTPDFSDSLEDNHGVTDSYNVASLLNVGSNKLVVRVKNWALPGAPIEHNPGGLLFNLHLENNQCPAPIDNEDPETSKVFIKKYVDNETASFSGEDAPNFSIDVSGSGFVGPIVLTPNNYQGEHEFDNASGDIVIAEDTTDSNTLPYGATCEEGKYRLVGYTSGNSWEDAVGGSKTNDSSIVISNISQDKYVIVWNETCPDEEVVVDMCLNIEGDQSVIPEGYHQEGKNCIPHQSNPSDNNNGGGNGGGGSGGGSSLSGGRRRDVSGLFGSGEVLGASTEDDGLMCEPYLKEYIKLGAQNNPEEVKKLQIFLNQFFEVQNPVTGIYGQITFEMVKKFQAHQEVAVLTPWTIAGLPTDGPTGYVYKTTKRWINILKCPEMIANTPVPTLP